VVVFLGVPEGEVAGQPLTHHQLLQDYDEPLGDGNNMFVSVSAAGDTTSAPAGHRAVMISTHTALSRWAGLDESEYALRKKAVGERLIFCARRVYPTLGDRAVVVDVGTPRTYERFGFRPDGAVGGAQLTLRNSNQFAIPHDLGGPGLWLAGDSTWPGLGTVACALSSRLVAEGVLRERQAKGRTW
jgi:phytoene dehydrogenase-like protein